MIKLPYIEYRDSDVVFFLEHVQEAFWNPLSKSLFKEIFE